MKWAILAILLSGCMEKDDVEMCRKACEGRGVRIVTTFSCECQTKLPEEK